MLATSTIKNKNKNDRKPPELYSLLMIEKRREINGVLGIITYFSISSFSLSIHSRIFLFIPLDVRIKYANGRHLLVVELSYTVTFYYCNKNVLYFNDVLVYLCRMFEDKIKNIKRRREMKIVIFVFTFLLDSCEIGEELMCAVCPNRSVTNIR